MLALNYFSPSGILWCTSGFHVGHGRWAECALPKAYHILLSILAISQFSSWGYSCCWYFHSLSRIVHLKEVPFWSEKKVFQFFWQMAEKHTQKKAITTLCVSGCLPFRIDNNHGIMVLIHYLITFFLFRHDF